MSADHISERDVMRLWMAGAYRQDMLRTEDGTPVQVLFAGIPSAHGGPDLTAARLRIGGQIRSGDVELHLSTEGWNDHHHASDGAYQNVILHVALRRGGRAGAHRPYGAGPIPELVLESFLEQGPWEAVRKVRALEPPASGGDPDRAGAERFARRVGRYALMMRFEDPDRLHFTETMRALGFGGNQAAFVELARRAGPDPAGWDRAASALPWRRQGIRPANRPARRLQRFAAYVARTLRPFEELCRLIGSESDDRALVRRLADRFGLGRQRALQIVFSIDLPMAATRPELAARMERIEATHPPLDSTRPARLAGRPAGTVRSQMGLIELTRRHLRGAP